MRTVHVYVSMVSMLIVAFVAFTGLTLNHPTWSLGSTTTDISGGTVPHRRDGPRTASTTSRSPSTPEARSVSRATSPTTAREGDVGTIDFAGPGYSASVRFSLTDHTLTTTITESDLLAILDDVHKGHDTDRSWSWVIDASAILLLLVTLTGIGIQVLQRKRRRSALWTTGALSALTVGLVWVAIR